MNKYFALAGKKVVVIGLARSGSAAAKLLAGQGASVIVNDQKDATELAKELAGLAGLPGASFVLGSHPEAIVDVNTALVVKNPGVPADLPPLRKAAILGIPVITEVELAFWFISAPIIGITGTNGKTTTTALAGEMFKASGRRTFVAGNIGLPLSAIAHAVREEDAVVVELSSFQLEGTRHFRPRVAVILNITPDHLDYHGSFTAYRKAKARIFANQGAGDALVLNADDPETASLKEQAPADIYLFSRRCQVAQGAYVRQGTIYLRATGEETAVCTVEEIRIPGAHNLENALAAALAAWLGGVPVATIAGVLRTFPGVPHRLEVAGRVGGIVFINDSKGTNPDAAIKALEAFAAPKVLIAGGYDKGGSYAELAAQIKKHAEHAVLLGESAPRLSKALEAAGYYSHERAISLEDAVHRAYRAAKPGYVVLLSPACASWDMFRDYEERGERFKQAVRELEETEDGP